MTAEANNVRLERLNPWDCSPVWVIILMILPFTAYFNANYLYLPLIWVAACLTPWRTPLPNGSVWTFLLVYPLIAAIIGYHFIQAAPRIAADEVRHYFGFAFIYPVILLMLWDRPKQLRMLAFWYCLILSFTYLFEALVINVIPEVMQILGNYPDFSTSISYKTSFFGFYQRPYGLGAHHSGTSATIIILLTFLSFQRNWISPLRFLVAEMAAVFAVGIGASGTGYAFLLMYGCIRCFFGPLKKIAIVPVGILLLMPWLVLLSPGYSENSILHKISAPYAWFLLKHKFLLSQQGAPIDTYTWDQIILGAKSLAQIKSFTWTDFALNSFFNVFGLVGFAVYLGTMIFHIRWFTAIPLFMFILSLFHYSALFVPVGQVAICLILVAGVDSSNIRLRLR